MNCLSKLGANRTGSEHKLDFHTCLFKQLLEEQSQVQQLIRNDDRVSSHPKNLIKSLLSAGTGNLVNLATRGDLTLSYNMAQKCYDKTHSSLK